MIPKGRHIYPNSKNVKSELGQSVHSNKVWGLFTTKLKKNE
jgi:hypothetical protein